MAGDLIEKPSESDAARQELVVLRARNEQLEQQVAKADANRGLLEEAQSIAHVGSWNSGIGSSDEILWSRECYRIFGVPEGTRVTVASFFAYVHHDDRERVQHASRGAWEDGARYDIAHRVTRPDGTIRWVQERAIVERDSAGVPTRMVGTVQDVTERHVTVEALQTSEREFRLLAEAMPQIVWITAPDGSTLYINQHWVEYTGMTLEDGLGAGWAGSFHPEDQRRAWLGWQHAIATNTIFAFEGRLRRADGAYGWWLIRGVPVRDASGNIRKWFGTCTDIDELKQAQARLVESEYSLRVVNDVAEALRTTVDPDQIMPAALRVLGQHLKVSRCGYAVVDADGEHCDMPHDYTDNCASMVGRYRLADFGPQLVSEFHRGGAPVVVRDVDAELPADAAAALTALGIKAFILCSLITEGHLRGLMAIHQASPRDWTARDVSIVQEVTARCWSTIEKAEVEAKLRDKETMLRITGDAARLGGWRLDLPDRRVTWSDEVCAILDFPDGTVPGLEQAMDLYLPEFREIIRAKIEACAVDGTAFDLELRVHTAQGRPIWVRVIGRAERNAAGAIARLHGAFQDIDERRKLQDQFRQAQKMEAVGRLAGGVAHDFNNLLSVILSYSDLALEALKPGDPLRADIAEIYRAGQRATELTRQLLAFSRQQVLDPHVVDLNAIISAMKPMLGRLLGAGIHLSVISSPVGRVIVDAAQIEQVVMNLAVNARDAMTGGGNLTLETSDAVIDDTRIGKLADVPPGHFVMLAVTDSGTGMSEATRARIFEPFFTTKEPGKGTGLGLATVLGIVQQSGGYVDVYSEPDHGTTFKIYLPRTDRIAEASDSASPSTRPVGSETILLVEDEDQVRTVACAILRKAGYNVLETSNGGEAFLVSREFPSRIDLLLTDVVMPRLSGRRLAEQLAPQRPEMKVLFVSGYTDDAIIQHGTLDSGVEFLQKPFTPNSLLSKVRDVLDANVNVSGVHAPRRQ